MRRLYVLFGFLVGGLLVGCHDPSGTSKHVGIVLFGEVRAPQVQGFIGGLRELGYRDGENVHYTVLSAENDVARLPELFLQLHEKGVDLMVAAGGLEADAMKVVARNSKIPCVVLYANSILERSLVDARGDPGWEVTGIDNLNAELSGKRLELLSALAPTTRRVLILYYPNIDPSRIGVEEAVKAAANLGLKIDARPVQSRDEVLAVMNGLRARDVDAVLTVPTAPIDNELRELVLPTIKRLRLPLIVHSRSMAEEGALASYGATLFSVGEQAARLAAKVLGGVPASKIPFEIPKRFIYTINVTAMRELKIELNGTSRSQVHDYVSTVGA